MDSLAPGDSPRRPIKSGNDKPESFIAGLIILLKLEEDLLGD
jgi:hypothetical protein